MAACVVPASGSLMILLLHPRPRHKCQAIGTLGRRSARGYAAEVALYLSVPCDTKTTGVRREAAFGCGRQDTLPS